MLCRGRERDRAKQEGEGGEVGGKGEKVGALSLVPLTETRYLTLEGETEGK